MIILVIIITHLIISFLIYTVVIDSLKSEVGEDLGLDGYAIATMSSFAPLVNIIFLVICLVAQHNRYKN